MQLGLAMSQAKLSWLSWTQFKFGQHIARHEFNMNHIFWLYNCLGHTRETCYDLHGHSPPTANTVQVASDSLEIQDTTIGNTFIYLCSLLLSLYQSRFDIQV